MRSLGQLNQHLDDEHTEVAPDVSEIGVGSWLQKQLVKGGRLQSVAAIGKSLKFSEEFERNGDSTHTGLEATQQTDAVVSTDHWQVEHATSQCTEASCHRRARVTERDLPAYEIQYDLLQQYRKAIDSLLPRYQGLLTSLVSDSVAQYGVKLEEARRLRKRIVDAFALFEALSRKIANLPAETDTQGRLLHVISREAITYLQSRVLSLQTTSQFRKNQSQGDAAETNVQNQVEQAALRDELTMFTEQQFLLQQQADDARRRRKFDDLASLMRSLDEIDVEVKARQNRLILWSADLTSTPTF
ncbi:putative Vacuolar segregation protein [Taphrina deformans PYCC 5710]|uniref:Vacuolar segregation protein n=1 Tax=Taphrina deformans (strain PYCC 5710 / ATCC 11124 / CBS 356.35 / IMI 108563 / JCM 9778 / NBRC 8474) TaxID=1097556 RepID=R4XF41_TAPDE|nr:putative Vacuolar segregation protein [Taphrina deformans PYCC 5710]|eukprot:CCG81977.1 putative Vacuolar segregation protein [Taphrina deformans PYCC 5710]